MRLKPAPRRRRPRPRLRFERRLRAPRALRTAAPSGYIAPGVVDAINCRRARRRGECGRYTNPRYACCRMIVHEHDASATVSLMSSYAVRYDRADVAEELPEKAPHCLTMPSATTGSTVTPKVLILADLDTDADAVCAAERLNSVPLSCRRQWLLCPGLMRWWLTTSRTLARRSSRSVSHAAGAGSDAPLRTRRVSVTRSAARRRRLPLDESLDRSR